MVKAPKIYFADTGLLCYLLNLTSMDACLKTPLLGHLWENFVFSELLKTLLVKPGRNLFYYRDQNGVEMDFMLELADMLYLVEAKSSERVETRKLNFVKIAPLFKARQIRCVLMCASTEKTPLELKDYAVMNPLRHDLTEVLKM